MTKIKLQFTRSKGVISSLIAWGTWSWASHVDFIFEYEGVELLLGANSKGGVSIRSASLVRKQSSRYEIYEVDVHEEDEREQLTVEAIHVHALLYLGRSYDWGGIIGFLPRKYMEHKDKWFCSEFVAYIMSSNGIALVNEKPHRITPRDLLSSTKLVKVN